MAQPKTKSDSIESPFDTVTKLEVPAAVRDFAEKGVAQAKDAYVKFMQEQGLGLLKKHGFRVSGPWAVAVGKWTEFTLLFRCDSPL